MRLFAGLAVAAYATAASGQGWTIKDWPDRPRGGEGTFQQLWTNRIATDPGDGIASHYNDRLTATGERLRPWAETDLTCSRPDASELGACLKVSYRGRSIICRVSDIGPHPRLKRAIDLTPAGFKMLGLELNDGLGKVSIERVSRERCGNWPDARTSKERISLQSGDRRVDANKKLQRKKSWHRRSRRQ